eukprot:g3972.t1 g3972   contig15:54290-54776(+)
MKAKAAKASIAKLIDETYSNQDLSTDKHHMSSQATAIIDVGTPPPTTLNLEKLFTFNFHNFESLDSTKGTFVISPSFKCFDHEWAVTLYPGGNKKETMAWCLCIFARRQKAASQFNTR